MSRSIGWKSLGTMMTAVIAMLRWNAVTYAQSAADLMEESDSSPSDIPLLVLLAAVILVALASVVGRIARQRNQARTRRLMEEIKRED